MLRFFINAAVLLVLMSLVALYADPAFVTFAVDRFVQAVFELRDIALRLASDGTAQRLVDKVLGGFKQ